MSKSGKDISSVYTKYLNKFCGRKGYCLFDKEKEIVITPKEYGMFLKNK